MVIREEEGRDARARCRVTGSFTGVAVKDFKGAGNPQFTFSEYWFSKTKSIMSYELLGLFLTEISLSPATCHVTMV